MALSSRSSNLPFTYKKGLDEIRLLFENVSVIVIGVLKFKQSVPKYLLWPKFFGILVFQNGSEQVWHNTMLFKLFPSARLLVIWRMVISNSDSNNFVP